MCEEKFVATMLMKSIQFHNLSPLSGSENRINERTLIEIVLKCVTIMLIKAIQFHSLSFSTYFFQRSALTEEDILNVAKKLADELSIRTLGLALGVDGSVIDAAVADQNKVNLQALTVLKAWREKVGPDEAAYFQLGNTLRDKKFVEIAEKVLSFY